MHRETFLYATSIVPKRCNAVDRRLPFFVFKFLPKEKKEEKKGKEEKKKKEMR
jgi:hypothetical protein